MLAELARQDRLANDLANASTPGYKADRVTQHSFGELLLSDRSNGQTVGSIDFGAQIADVQADLTQGPLRETGEPLDVALEGPGFLAVRDGNETRYTRAGQLARDAQGRLVTSGGQLVLSEEGQPITIGSGAATIAADGGVTVDGKPAGRLRIVSLTDPQKVGDTLFTGTPGARPAGTSLRQGFLEGSGIDPARAMVDMIASLRAFESVQRAIHAIDETLGRGINGSGA